MQGIKIGYSQIMIVITVKALDLIQFGKSKKDKLMASIQSMLAIGALVIFSIVSLLFNSSYMQSSAIEIEDKVYLTAFSLADDLIEEMKQKAFDEKTIDFQAIRKDQLTLPAALGKEGETWPNFDDIDDYKGYVKNVDAPHAEGYHINCNVEYCDANGNVLGIQDYYKKVTISVSSDFLRDPFQMYFVFSLHSKN